MRYGSLFIDDIEKSKPRVLHYSMKNKPVFNLSNQDTERSSPFKAGFQRALQFNPLEPIYKL